MGAEVTTMRGNVVILAKAGIQMRELPTEPRRQGFWIPAYAGMTEWVW